MRTSAPSRLAAVAIALATVIASPAPAGAQYFGRQKVQYKTFDFQILNTTHFDIYFYEEEKQGAELAGRMAERWHARLTRLLRHDLRGRQPLILYASHPDFEQTNAIPGELGEGTGGVTEMTRRRIVLPLGGPLADTDHVVGHELVHAFQFDMTRTPQGGPNSVPGALRLPLWFIEGMAEYLSLGPFDPHTAMWMRDAVRQEKLPEIKDLDNRKYFPYRWGHAFWAYVTGRYGDGVVGEMLRLAGATGDPERAIEQVLGVDAKELSAEWHAALRSAYEPVLRASDQADRVARPLTSEKRRLGGELNIGPSLSPDGSRIAFLSERGLLSIDLYVADVASGRVTDKLTSTAVNPHFSSLQFINSAGAWSADGRRFLFAAIVGGEPALAIYDVARKRMEREIRVDAVDEIFNPTWSPDGRTVAFSAMVGGFTDLFVYDVTTNGGALNRLTSDPHADIQPAWSPDGRSIAFATSRFSTELRDLDVGPYRIALIDPATRRIEQVAGLDNAKNINPQWAPDSASLYFISDRNGISNVYRVQLGSSEIRQVTNLSTGVSGITASSPALSSALRAPRIAFSVYENGQHRLYTLGGSGESGSALVGQAPGALYAASPAMLPPLERRTTAVASALRNPGFGLPPAGQGSVQDYKPSLGLDYVGQPSMTVGADRFGSYAGGGMAFFLSDMLGDHSVAAAVQVNQSLTGNFDVKDVGGLIGYQNLKRRWNWAVTLEQTPYSSGGYGSDAVIINGEPAVVERAELFRQTSRGATAIAAYPFSRVHRVEFSAGVRNLSFDHQVRTTAYSQRSGDILLDKVSSESFAAPLTFGQASAALVYDSSSFGATSPVAGQRYRFEIAPTTGGITFSNVLADYRRYFMPAPFYTIAGRVMHYGRYGRDAEDVRLMPLFLGYPYLVRGYDVGSFDARECVGGASGECPAFDRLVGSRIAVANVELRFPLLRPFGLRPGMYGPIPIEAALFADTGVAWDTHTRPEFLDGNRKMVSSVGVAFRVNALGFAVVQIDLAKPLQRAGKGWVWQFSLSPGF